MTEQRRSGRFTNAITPTVQQASDSYIDVLRRSDDPQVVDTARNYFLDVTVGEGMRRKEDFGVSNIAKMGIHAQAEFKRARERADMVEREPMTKDVYDDVRDFTTDMSEVMGNEMLGTYQDGARKQREIANRDIRGKEELIKAHVVEVIDPKPHVKQLTPSERVAAVLTGKVVINGDDQTRR